MLGDRYSRRNVLLCSRALARSRWRPSPRAVALGGPPVACSRSPRCSPRSAPGTSPRRRRCCRRWPTARASSPPRTRVWSAVDSVGFLRRRAPPAAVLIACRGVELALAATAVAFLLAALALAGIPRRPPAGPAPPAPPGRGARDRRGLRTLRADAGAAARRRRARRRTLVEGAIDVLVVLVALELLDLGSAGVGWLNSAWGLGGMLGGAGAVLLVARGRNATGLVARRRSLIGVAAARARPRCRSSAVAAVGLVVLGVGYAVMEVAGLTLVQRLASDAVLARAFGVVEGTYWLTTGIGLAARAGPRARRSTCAARCSSSAPRSPLLVARAAGARSPGSRRSRAGARARVPAAARLPMFAPLPIARRRGAGDARSRPSRVPAGADDHPRGRAGRPLLRDRRRRGRRDARAAASAARSRRRLLRRDRAAARRAAHGDRRRAHRRRACWRSTARSSSPRSPATARALAAGARIVDDRLEAEPPA